MPASETLEVSGTFLVEFYSHSQAVLIISNGGFPYSVEQTNSKCISGYFSTLDDKI